MGQRGTLLYIYIHFYLIEYVVEHARLAATGFYSHRLEALSLRYFVLLVCIFLLAEKHNALPVILTYYCLVTHRERAVMGTQPPPLSITLAAIAASCCFEIFHSKYCKI
jgi:hypothetical protein